MQRGAGWKSEGFYLCLSAIPETADTFPVPPVYSWWKKKSLWEGLYISNFEISALPSPERLHRSVLIWVKPSVCLYYSVCCPFPPSQFSSGFGKRDGKFRDVGENEQEAPSLFHPDERGELEILGHPALWKTEVGNPSGNGRKWSRANEWVYPYSEVYGRILAHGKG